jgi:hypothetical protein
MIPFQGFSNVEMVETYPMRTSSCFTGGEVRRHGRSAGLLGDEGGGRVLQGFRYMIYPGVLEIFSCEDKGGNTT